MVKNSILTNNCDLQTQDAALGTPKRNLRCVFDLPQTGTISAVIEMDFRGGLRSFRVASARRRSLIPA